jgi:hypothetical protein
MPLAKFSPNAAETLGLAISLRKSKYPLNLSLASLNPGILPNPLLKARFNLSLSFSISDVIVPFSTAFLMSVYYPNERWNYAIIAAL